jgi:hypothetical protein
MKRWAIGWIAAAVALAAILIVVVDIVRTQSGRSVESAAPLTQTSEAARSAGASVTPSDPKQAR